MTVRIITGDCREALRSLPAESVQCVVTSPPYWGLRDYGNGDAGIGLERSLSDHLAAIVTVFQEVHRVLRSDGTLWLNYGDAYAGSWGAQSRGEAPGPASALSGGQVHAAPKGTHTGSAKRTPGLKPKDLMGLPWRIAFALQDDGWWLRQDIIWSKPNPMPESVTDRCTKSHEYIFLMSKSARYRFDADAIAEGLAPASVSRLAQDVERQAGSDRVPGKTNGPMRAVSRVRGVPPRHAQYASSDQSGLDDVDRGGRRNKRSVWTIATQPFSDAHFATFPPELVEPCILAGCPEGGTVLDPFGGAGTVGLVADRLQRSAILIELNPEYAAMARCRIEGDAPMFAQVTA